MTPELGFCSEKESKIRPKNRNLARRVCLKVGICDSADTQRFKRHRGQIKSAFEGNRRLDRHQGHAETWSSKAACNQILNNPPVLTGNVEECANQYICSIYEWKREAESPQKTWILAEMKNFAGSYLVFMPVCWRSSLRWAVNTQI